MNQDFILEFDYFYSRSKLLQLLGTIATDHNNEVLEGFGIFVNNIPTSLEFYVYLSYNADAKNEIEDMKKNLIPVSIYRPDLSYKILFNRIDERRFNYIGILDLFSLKSALLMFEFSNKKELPSRQYFNNSYVEYLKTKGYKAFNKLEGETTLFFSHSSKQKKELEEVIPYFNSNNELIWLDKYRLNSHADKKVVKREIARGLNEANKVLFYITDDFLKSWWCIFELILSYRIFLERENYSLLFIIENSVEKKFRDKYSTLFRNILSNNIMILRSDQKIEEQIRDFIVNKVNII